MQIVWPDNFQSSFVAVRSLRYRVAWFSFFVGIVKTPARVAGTAGIVVVAIGIGIALAGLTSFPSYWPWIAVIPPVFLVAIVVYTVFNFPSRLASYDRYRPGSSSRVTIENGQIRFLLNNHSVTQPVGEAMRIWHFGSLSAIEFKSTKFIVIPTSCMPHKSSRTSFGSADGLQNS